MAPSLQPHLWRESGLGFRCLRCWRGAYTEAGAAVLQRRGCLGAFAGTLAQALASQTDGHAPLAVTFSDGSVVIYCLRCGAWGMRKALLHHLTTSTTGFLPAAAATMYTWHHPVDAP